MIILGTNSIKDTGYEVANSCRFNSGDSAYLHKSTSSGTNTKFTFSAWIKRSSSGSNYPRILGSYTDGSNYLRLNWNRATDGEQLHLYSEASTAAQLLTNRSFRDPSAWMHIVVAVDTTDGTADDRMKMYINGVQETSFATRANPGQNDNFKINNGSSTLTIGKKEGADSDYFDGYMAEVHYVDGTAYAASDFGEFDEDSPTIWKPKEASGISYGTNGFYLDFKDSSNLGNDANGGTDLTEVNLAATDQSSDSPTNNFATLNPLNVPTSNAPVMSEGNLKTITMNADPGYFGGTSTIGMSQGKWYAEIKDTDDNGVGCFGITFNPGEVARNGASFSAQIEDSFVYANTGKIYSSATGTSGSSYGNTFTDGDIIGIALDMDNNKLYFSKNGTWQNSGNPESGATGTGAISITANETYFFYLTDVGGTLGTYECNFGSPPYAISSGNADANGYGNFEYSVPSNYYSLCSKNLAEFGG